MTKKELEKARSVCLRCKRYVGTRKVGDNYGVMCDTKDGTNRTGLTELPEDCELLLEQIVNSSDE